jgi:hypothetical protein
MDLATLTSGIFFMKPPIHPLLDNSFYNFIHYYNKDTPWAGVLNSMWICRFTDKAITKMDVA